MCVPLWNMDNIAIAKCICAAGYISTSNGTCVVKTPSTFLIFSKSKPASIKGITLDGSNETIVPITKITRPEPIDFDAENRTILFADDHKIGKATLEGGEISVILNEGVGKSAGISYDWLTKNLYWTDEDKGSINVINLLNTTQKRTLILDINIRPGSIIVNPHEGIMFWVHNSWLRVRNGYIEKSWMDGSNRIKLMEFNNSWISGLAIDFTNKELYWSEAVHSTIERMDFDGKSRQKFLSTNIEHPFGLSFYNGMLFFAEFMRGTIMRYDIKTKHLRLIDSGSEPLLQTKVYAASIQTGENPCKNNTCPELCLSIPKNITCVCSDGYNYLNGKCTKRLEKKLNNCPNGTFSCQPEGTCIPNKYKCDGVVDCVEYTADKLKKFVSCKSTLCNSTQFLCDGNLCIDNDWVCDMHKDCADGSDEDPQKCKNKCDPEHKFQCKTSQKCISKSKVCDNNYDCGGTDKSDEENCGKIIQQNVDNFKSLLFSLEKKECDVTEFTCKNKVCITFLMYCDGVDDCGDNSDEIDCLHCEADHIPCQPTQTCIPLTRYCNQIPDCPDGSDEEDCIVMQCAKDQFPCSSTLCISSVSTATTIDYFL